MLAEVQEYPAYKTKCLGRNDFHFQHDVALVRFAPNADDSSGTVARLIPENVPSLSKMNGWTAEPVSESTEVHLLCHLYCREGEAISCIHSS